MLNRRDMADRISITAFPNSYRRMSPNRMDSRKLVGGLAMISPAANAAGNTSRPFYPEEVRNELGFN
jgi:hypothetical protein